MILVECALFVLELVAASCECLALLQSAAMSDCGWFLSGRGGAHTKPSSVVPLRIGASFARAPAVTGVQLKALKPEDHRLAT